MKKAHAAIVVWALLLLGDVFVRDNSTRKLRLYRQRNL